MLAVSVCPTSGVVSFIVGAPPAVLFVSSSTMLSVTEYVPSNVTEKVMVSLLSSRSSPTMVICREPRTSLFVELKLIASERIVEEIVIQGCLPSL